VIRRFACGAARQLQQEAHRPKTAIALDVPPLPFFHSLGRVARNKAPPSKPGKDEGVPAEVKALALRLNSADFVRR
jgi:hypothetical protein